jgi:mono/diheme cytochrome c family protein
MKAETADYLAKACATLKDAEQIAALPLPHIAAREAYLAVFAKECAPFFAFVRGFLRPK